MNLDETFDAHLQRITTDLSSWLSLFAEDAVVEFPYAASIGFPARIEGRAALRRHFEDVVSKMAFGTFSFSNVRRYPSAVPTEGWFEVHGRAERETGEVYEQDYVMRMQLRDGLIVHYVEYWNMVAILALVGKK